MAPVLSLPENVYYLSEEFPAKPQAGIEQEKEAAMYLNTYRSAPSDPLRVHIKAGLIRALCDDGLLTQAQRDELLRCQRTAETT